ncbi:unnamed protein product [Pipistrellus nathusii]|uniref:Uncharacterized protein n=1 Tax=Pipistrellus nathusii TaxID=59473 RepID=A0ABP0AI44_PIPNA
MFISTKLTSGEKPQVCTTSPVRLAVFTVMPFHRETFVPSFVSYNKDKGGGKCTRFEKQQVNTSLHGIKQNKTPFSLPPAFPRKKKKKKKQKYLLLLCTISKGYLLLHPHIRIRGITLGLPNAYFIKL